MSLSHLLYAVSLCLFRISPNVLIEPLWMCSVSFSFMHSRTVLPTLSSSRTLGEAHGNLFFSNKREQLFIWPMNFDRERWTLYTLNKISRGVRLSLCCALHGRSLSVENKDSHLSISGYRSLLVYINVSCLANELLRRRPSSQR